MHVFSLTPRTRGFCVIFMKIHVSLALTKKRGFLIIFVRGTSAKMADPFLVTFGYPFEAVISAIWLQNPSQNGAEGFLFVPPRGQQSFPCRRVLCFLLCAQACVLRCFLCRVLRSRSAASLPGARMHRAGVRGHERFSEEYLRSAASLEAIAPTAHTHPRLSPWLSQRRAVHFVCVCVCVCVCVRCAGLSVHACMQSELAAQQSKGLYR